MPTFSVALKENDGRKMRVYSVKKGVRLRLALVWILTKPPRIITWANCLTSLSLIRSGYCNLLSAMALVCFSGISRETSLTASASLLDIHRWEGRDRVKLSDQEVHQSPSKNVIPRPNILFLMETYLFFYSEDLKHAQISKTKKYGGKK